MRSRPAARQGTTQAYGHYRARRLGGPIKRHFREIGKDIQTRRFHLYRRRDMSGDVFGNAMLLSKHTRLLAAFDHRHIFCDPDPDPALGFDERKRLFNLSRSSWADYDRRKSPGRRRFRAVGKNHQAYAGNQKNVRHRGGQPFAGRTNSGHAESQNRPALFRRHRHFYQGQRRDA